MRTRRRGGRGLGVGSVESGEEGDQKQAGKIARGALQIVGDWDGELQTAFSMAGLTARCRRG